MSHLVQLTEEEWLDLGALVATLWPASPIPAESIGSWYELVRGAHPSDLHDAILAHAAKHAFPPHPSELLRTIATRRRERVAERIRSERAAQRSRPTGRGMPPETRRAMEIIAGLVGTGRRLTEAEHAELEHLADQVDARLFPDLMPPPEPQQAELA